MTLSGEEKGRLLELAEEFSFDDPGLLAFVPFEPKISSMSWMMPGGVNSFSCSRAFFESIATTWVIEGRRWAAAWVQKRAIFMNLKASSGYGPTCGSTNSDSLPSS